MSSFLDKLAMNVGSWTAMGFYKAGMKNEDYELLNDPCMEAAWEERRKELINEPDDADAPEWAKWKAQDLDGKWIWCDRLPTVANGFWDTYGSCEWASDGKIPAGHDWRTTLKEVSKVDNLKEVKLAWANGGIVQYFCHIDNTWKDWGNSQSLNIDWYKDWRVKPMPITHTQWERKYYCPNNKAVITAINTLSDQFLGEKMWLNEPEFYTYEVE